MDSAAMTGMISTDFRIGSSRWVRLNDRNLTVERAEIIRARTDYIFSNERNNPRNGVLFACLQLALQGRKQLRTPGFDDPRRLRRRLGLGKIQLLDAAGALFDLVGRDQDL